MLPPPLFSCTFEILLGLVGSVSIIITHLIGGNPDCQAMSLSPLLLFSLSSSPRYGRQHSTPHVRDIARHNSLKSFPARSWAGGMETVPAWVRQRPRVA